MARSVPRRARLKVPPGAADTGVFLEGPADLPQIGRAGLVQLGPAWRQHEHAHDGVHEVHYVRQGRGAIVCDGRAYPVRAGSIYFFRPGESHGGTVDARDPSQILFLQVRFPSSLNVRFGERHAGRPIFLGDEGADELRAALKSLADEMAARADAGGGHASLRADAVVTAKMLHVLGALLEPVRRLAAASGTPRERELAELALRDLELCAAAPPSIGALARKLHVTPAYLGSALRAATGRTFPEAAADVRVRNARRMLADPAVPVREAARRVGLSGPRALARLFKRVTGRLPKDFR